MGSETDIIFQESEKLSTIPAIDGSADEETILKETRSRRPTMVGALQTSPSLADGAARRESGIEPAIKEPWTARRVFWVTWNYVTTVKAPPTPNITAGD